MATASTGRRQDSPAFEHSFITHLAGGLDEFAMPVLAKTGDMPLDRDVIGRVGKDHFRVL